SLHLFFLHVLKDQQVVGGLIERGQSLIFHRFKRWLDPLWVLAIGVIFGGFARGYFGFFHLFSFDGRDRCLISRLGGPETGLYFGKLAWSCRGIVLSAVILPLRHGESLLTRSNCVIENKWTLIRM